MYNRSNIGAQSFMPSNTRMFSNMSSADAAWNNALLQSSRSTKDAELRRNVYSKVFSRYDDLINSSKAFSGYTEVPLLSNQYFNATMASYVRSFAGFLTIERDMDQPQSLLWYMDMLGVTDNRVVLPNIGKENIKDINARFSTTAVFTVPAEGVDPDPIAVSTGKKLIPGSVTLKLIHKLTPDAAITITDDSNGNFLSPAGILNVNPKSGTSEVPNVNYSTGIVTFTMSNGSGFTIAEGDSYVLSAFEDIAGTPEFGGQVGSPKNRFKMDMKNITLNSEPDMLVAENNLMAIAAMQKAIGANPQDVAGAKLTELYTKLVNYKLVHAIMDNYQGETYNIEAASAISKFQDFNSRLDFFQSELINVDTKMAEKSVKGVRATAYLVGENVGNWFRKLVTTGNFVDNNNTSYVNDLLGYYKGVPVLRHTDIPTNEGYAIHKTADGQLAPLMRGIYLPLTNSPLIGNYNNPTQFAQGIYYQEVNQSIIPELDYKFTVDA
jgi:hypothetical protein